MSADSLHILLVDDHAESLTVLARLLERCGYSVATARTYAEAVEVAGRRRCDLLVSDVGLPDRSGLELMQELNARYPIRGIALSGYTDERDVRASRAAGFARHLNKPIMFADLLSTIREVAEWHAPGVPAPADAMWHGDNGRKHTRAPTSGHTPGSTPASARDTAGRPLTRADRRLFLTFPLQKPT